MTVLNPISSVLQFGYIQTISAESRVLYISIYYIQSNIFRGKPNVWLDLCEIKNRTGASGYRTLELLEVDTGILLQMKIFQKGRDRTNPEPAS
jgi:hypothetical protein